MEIWLKGSKNFRFPINPSEYTVTSEHGSETVDVNALGEIDLGGKRKLRKVSFSSFFPARRESYICDGFYTQNTALMSGFHGVDNAICNLGYQTQQGFNTTNVALMQGQNALQSQLANCCCETREAIQGVNYNMAQNTCALQNTMNSNTRDIIDSQNAGTRAILDYLCNEKISSLQAENNDLRRAASQDRQSALLTTAMASQTQQIINAVNPAPIPAYQVPNPNVYYGCGCNSGCVC